MFSAAWPAAAQNHRPVMDLPRLSGPIVLDGRGDDQAWQEIAPLPLVQYQPVHLGPMTEKSIIKVAHDDHYIYILGELYDSKPEEIRANSLYRNRYSGDETFAIILDSYNDNENAKWFFVTPLGVRVDHQVSNDAEGHNSANRDWNTFWDVATRITDEGWFAEIRIPFSSIGFTRTNDEVIMGMIVYRYIARNAERHIFPDISPTFSRGQTKPSQAQKIRLTGVEYTRPFYITPYFLGGFDQQSRFDAPTASYQGETHYTREIGLDVKVPISGNLHLDITLNTDFAQVEADETQINLSRTPLFFPEKRQFFQERSDIFDFNLGGPNTLFYSRRIGLERGRQVRILGGARLAGRLGQWEIGLLNMQTEGVSELGLESRNFGVYRARRDLINTHSHLGAMVTSRIGIDGAYNVAAGMDFLYNYAGNHFLDLKLATTFDCCFEESFSPADNGLLRLNVHRRTNRGFYYNATIKRGGERYLPAMGFEARNNYTRYDASLFWGHFASPRSSIRILTPSIRFYTILRNHDQSVETIRLEQPWSFSFKDGSRMTIQLNWSYEHLTEPLLFSPRTWVEPGTYGFAGGHISYGMDGSNYLRTSVSASAARFYDGQQFALSVGPTWNQSRHFEISGSFSFNMLSFPERDQREFLNVFRLQSLMALNTHLSLQVLAQYNQLDRQVSMNARFRYNFSEGHDFWVVYNEMTNTELDRVIPVLPRLDNRVLLVKYVYTIIR